MTGRFNTGDGSARGISRAFATLHKAQRGVTLVELLVAMGIFMVFSSLFTVTIIQFLHTTNADAVRMQSSSQILTATERLDRLTRYASDVHYDESAKTVTMLIPKSSAVSTTSTTSSTSQSSECVVLTYGDNGSGLYNVWYQTKTVGSSAYSSKLSLLSNISPASSASPVFSYDSDSKVLSFTPQLVRYSGGSKMTTQVSRTFAVRNTAVGGSYTSCQ